METVLTCPLGSVCERAIDGRVERCQWYITIEGVNPQNGSRLPDQSRCAMSWIPILLIDNTQKTISTTASVDILRHMVSSVPEPTAQVIPPLVKEIEVDNEKILISQ